MVETDAMSTHAASATARLLLRPPRRDDAPALFAFLGDADAMRFTQVDRSLRQCRRRIAVHERARRRDGCAPWTIVDKASGAPIGWGGLYRDPFAPGWGVELGYFFRPSAWGRGYASELARHCVAIADRELGLDQLQAFAHEENTASRKILEKLGFEEIRRVPAMNRLLYRRRRKPPSQS